MTFFLHLKKPNGHLFLSLADALRSQGEKEGEDGIGSCSSFRCALFFSGPGRARKGEKKRRSTSPYGKRGSGARCVDLVAEDLPTDCDRFQVTWTTKSKKQVSSSSGSQWVCVAFDGNVARQVELRAAIGWDSLLPESRLKRVRFQRESGQLMNRHRTTSSSPFLWAAHLPAGDNLNKKKPSVKRTFVDVRTLFPFDLDGSV